MGQTAKPPRQNRTLTVDFHSETTYFALLGNTKAFIEFVLAFILSLGFQLTHKASCSEGGRLTRHSHDARVRLGGLILWRIQCTTCKAVFTVLPHFVLRYRQMRPEVARDALLATQGGLSLVHSIGFRVLLQEWLVICYNRPDSLAPRSPETSHERSSPIQMAPL